MAMGDWRAPVRHISPRMVACQAQGVNNTVVREFDEISTRSAQQESPKPGAGGIMQIVTRAPIAQRIERSPPEAEAQVRVLVGALKISGSQMQPEIFYLPHPPQTNRRSASC